MRSLNAVSKRKEDYCISDKRYFLVCQFFHGIESVSYTHLDVYKRQNKISVVYLLK